MRKGTLDLKVIYNGSYPRVVLMYVHRSGEDWLKW